MPTGRVAVIERIVPGGLNIAGKIDVRFDRSPYDGALRAIRQGRWKYIVADNGQEELYDVASDPGEVNNLVETHRPIADVLVGRLQKWLAAARIYKGKVLQGGERKLDEETRRRLRALGYIQ